MVSMDQPLLGLVASWLQVRADRMIYLQPAGNQPRQWLHQLGQYCMQQQQQQMLETTVIQATRPQQHRQHDSDTSSHSHVDAQSTRLLYMRQQPTHAQCTVHTILGYKEPCFAFQTPLRPKPTDANAHTQLILHVTSCTCRLGGRLRLPLPTPPPKPSSPSAPSKPSSPSSSPEP
jgi:hypothetical protein